MRVIRSVVSMVVLTFLACGGDLALSGPDALTAGAGAGQGFMALFYQDVTPTSNEVRTGLTTNGHLVDSTGKSLLNWRARGGDGTSYGDPVFSRLPNGRWTLTAWSGATDPRGAAGLIYYEGSCPQVDESAVVVIGPNNSSACTSIRGVVSGKTSQVFEADGATYVFSSMEGRLRLLKLSDPSHPASQLSSICLRRTPAASLSELAVGEATIVIDEMNAPGLRVSDSGIARRRDGTWVLFVKGVSSTSTCTQASLCELCARSIYRTTSPDLINWSTLEKVVDQASVPEASTFPDGSVAVYWQSFAETCAAQDQSLANRSPIRMAFETEGNVLGAPTALSFPEEAFETNLSLHAPTNANPVLLPSTEAASSLAACLAR